MEMMKYKRNVKVAWKDTENVLSSDDSQMRSLPMQLCEFAQRAEEKKLYGAESPLYAATCPYFYITRVFGLAPYEFDEHQSLVPSGINIMYSIFWICLHTYILYTVLWDFPHAISEDRSTLRMTKIGKVVFNYGVIIFDLILCLATRKRLTTIWNEIQNYDEIVRQLGYQKKERKTRYWVWSTIGFGTLIYTAINQTGMYAFCQSWVDNVAYLIMYVASAASVMKFSGIVMLLAQRFSHLNEISRNSMSVQSQWIIGAPKIDIRIIENLHNHLMILAEDLNSIYSWSILLWLSNLCFHHVTNLFFIISWILETDFNVDLMSCLLLWEISFIAQLLAINYVCHHASSKANCIGYIILGWRRQLFMRNRSMEIETSFHLINRKLNFSAAGCFNVDLPLLRSIASSFTTYLVILLQFE